MPNHCANQLTVKGPADQVVDFKERARGDEEVLDLNKFIPMPDELRSAESPSRDPKVVAALVEKYGTGSGYTWTAINWGTKWGCYDGEVAEEGDGYVTYRFYTAWRPFDQSVLEKMSGEYPELVFSLSFAEQLMDFWGAWDAGRGEIVGESGGDGIGFVPAGGAYAITDDHAETIQLLAGISG